MGKQVKGVEKELLRNRARLVAVANNANLSLGRGKFGKIGCGGTQPPIPNEAILDEIGG